MDSQKWVEFQVGGGGNFSALLCSCTKIKVYWFHQRVAVL